eukprot:CAMPEP_0173436014 /NCGR_PEP_ID=MMETSP1357-20121228/15713_1 /TAXON_ID=77926 /ORGANISM="Hemiselmis rufescens, Strain PCC563" /LENGTH=381 /DNA_ID=CAMNT_0014401059 /DNA_START=128 /DNA_END=1273 /DNA_ORIENTATION=-
MKGHEGTIRQCCFSSDGRLAVTASGDHTGRVWDLDTAACVSVMGSCPKNLTGGGIGTGHEHVVSGCDFSPDCTLVCTSSNDKAVRIWRASNGECLAILQGHMQIVNCCRWSPDGQAVISGSSDRSIRGWRLQDNGDGDMSKFKWGDGTVLEFAFGDCSSSLSEEHKDTDEFQRLAFKRREHLPNMKCLLTTMQSHTGSIAALDFSPGAGLESGFIASVGSDMVPHVWDCKKALSIDTAKNSLLVKMTPHKRAALTCAFSPNGQTLATGGQDCCVLLHSVADGSLLREVTVGDSYVTCVAFVGFDDTATPSTDDAYLLVSTGATKIKVLSLGDPSFQKNLPAAGRAVNTLALTRRSQAWQGQLGLLIGGGDNALVYVPKFTI